MHENVKPILEKKIPGGRGTTPAWTTPRHLRHSCPLCPTHFLVPSGAYAGHVIIIIVVVGFRQILSLGAW